MYTSLVLKRVGFSAKKRRLVLTDFPRLFYIDPSKNELKGEISWSSALRTEKKTYKDFFIITPKRTYQLEDLNGEAERWINNINTVLMKQKNNKK